jgi:hypothetical protein
MLFFLCIYLIIQKAEKNLEQCKSFEVSLPPSITGIIDDSNKVNNDF